MGKIIGGWDRAEVARAQLDLVLKELSAPETCGPYAAFRWAMDTIWIEAGTLLDAGCGVGHYGVLCERFYPHIRYHGTDLSAAMIEQARQLASLSTFSVCDFKDNAFGDYDIILTGQTIEQIDDPPAMLDWLLTHARRYVILNRVRLTHDKSHRIAEETYCGEMGRNWLWNLGDITGHIGQFDYSVTRLDAWATNQTTFVLRRLENDQSAELCGCAHEMDAVCAH